MSVSIYCQAHLNGDSQEIEVSEIIEAFSPHVVKSDEFGFKVEYDEMNSCFVYIDVKDKTCSSFSISKPCGDDRLYKAIFKCMKLGNFISYWSDGNKFYITNQSTISHIPSDMKEFLETDDVQTIVVNTVDEYLQEL